MIVHVIIATRYDPCQSTGTRCKDALLYPFCSSALSLWWTLRSLSSHFHLHQPDNDIIRSNNLALLWVTRDWLLKKEEKLTASINCLTSYSDNFVPCLASPCFSSSSVIVPLLSVSMPLNIFFNPMISSSDRQPAITYTHFKKTKKIRPRLVHQNDFGQEDNEDFNGLSNRHAMGGNSHSHSYLWWCVGHGLRNELPFQFMSSRLEWYLWWSFQNEPRTASTNFFQ